MGWEMSDLHVRQTMQDYSHVGRQPCEALSTTASHPQQEGIPEGLADYARDPCYVFEGVHEQLKFHLGCAHLVRRVGQQTRQAMGKGTPSLIFIYLLTLS